METLQAFNTRELIQNSTNVLKLVGPFDGSGRPMAVIEPLFHERYCQQFGQELSAWKLTTMNGDFTFLVPDRDATPMPDGGYVIQLYVGEDSPQLVAYQLYVA